MPPLKRDIDALLPILEDPRNEHRTSEQLARLLIAALDTARAKVRRDSWSVVFPTEEVRDRTIALMKEERGDGWNPWAPRGPVCRCGVRKSDPRDSGKCPVHPDKQG